MWLERPRRSTSDRTSDSRGAAARRRRRGQPPAGRASGAADADARRRREPAPDRRPPPPRPRRGGRAGYLRTNSRDSSVASSTRVSKSDRRAFGSKPLSPAEILSVGRASSGA